MKILLLGLTLFVSICALGKNDQTKLHGDWIRVTEWNEVSDYIGIRFDADTLYNIRTGLEVIGRYILEGQTIFIENFEHRVIIYKIEKHTADSLIISNSGSEFKYYSRNLEFDSSLAFTSIYLELGPSPDHRPEFKVRLNKNGKVTFKGLANCKVKGTKTFLMDKSRLKKIDSLFQWSNIERMKQMELGTVTDQLMILKIDYRRSQSKTVTGEYYKMPFRLRGLIWNLFRDLRNRDLI